ncbi:MAG: TraU family protein [Nitrospirota bacterium]
MSARTLLLAFGWALAVAALIVWPDDTRAESTPGCRENNLFGEVIDRTCWECIFPVSFAGFVLHQGDQPAHDPAKGQTSTLCFCCREGEIDCPPSVPIGYWEPVRLVEIVHEPFCFPSFGGVDLNGETDVEGRGSVGSSQADPERDMAYLNAHLVEFPLFAIIGLVTDVFCLNGLSFTDNIDVVYLTELDPLWSDDVAATVMAPEAALIANPIAQAACAADAIAASSGFPIDAMWWCAGAWGSLYPPTGNVSGATAGPVKSSALTMSRLIAHMARLGTEWYTAGVEGNICYDYPTFMIVKSQYKFQLLWPIANTAGAGIPCCSPLGRTTFMWGMSKTVPSWPEDFVYLLWRLQNCCMRLGA